MKDFTMKSESFGASSQFLYLLETIQVLIDFNLHSFHFSIIILFLQQNDLKKICVAILFTAYNQYIECKILHRLASTRKISALVFFFQSFNSLDCCLNNNPTIHSFFQCCLPARQLLNAISLKNNTKIIVIIIRNKQKENETKQIFHKALVISMI